MKKRVLMALFVAGYVAGCADDATKSADVVTGGQTTTGAPVSGTPSGRRNPADLRGAEAKRLWEQEMTGGAGAEGAADRVFFQYDRTELTPEGQSVLKRQADWLRTYANVTVSVEGHADERGTREYNLALGDRRAATVKNYLLAAGVQPNRVQTITYGKEKPAAVGSFEDAYSKNRRAVTTVD